MLRIALLFAALSVAFSVSAQSFENEVPAKDVPKAVRKAAKDLDYKGDGTWVNVHSDHYVMFGDKGMDIQLEGATVIAHTQMVEAPIPTEYAEVKHNVEQAFVGHGYSYLAYGETTLANGDKQLSVYLEMQGKPKALLVIAFDSNNKLVKRRIYKKQS